MIWYFHRCTCVMDLPALRTQRAICTVKFMQPLVMWQQRFDVGSYFLSLPSAFRPKCNQLICWWQWLPPRNFIKIRSVGLFMQSEKMPMLAQDRHPDIGTDIGTTGHSENIITYAATSLYYCRSYYDCFLCAKMMNWFQQSRAVNATHTSSGSSPSRSSTSTALPLRSAFRLFMNSTACQSQIIVLFLSP